MRYLVFGDVHANMEALDAVLAEGERREVEAHLFVGDLIGYGPSPLECMERLITLQERGSLAWVAGNHELAVRGEVPLDGYSAEALETLEWTRRLLELNPQAKKFVDAPTVRAQVNEAIWLTHDSLVEPGKAGYHRWPLYAKSELACLRWEGGRICFYGHTHVMRAEFTGEQTDIVLVPMDAHEGDGVDPHPLRLQGGALGWIGTGSVGLPTNPERRAEFLILDDAQWTVEKYAVAYPREKARERVKTVLGAVCSGTVAEHIAQWL
jgi:predicted phosphodiesterase